MIIPLNLIIIELLAKKHLRHHWNCQKNKFKRYIVHSYFMILCGRPSIAWAHAGYFCARQTVLWAPGCSATYIHVGARGGICLYWISWMYCQVERCLYSPPPRTKYCGPQNTPAYRERLGWYLLGCVVGPTPPTLPLLMKPEGGTRSTGTSHQIPSMGLTICTSTLGGGVF